MSGELGTLRILGVALLLPMLACTPPAEGESPPVRPAQVAFATPFVEASPLVTASTVVTASPKAPREVRQWVVTLSVGGAGRGPYWGNSVVVDSAGKVRAQAYSGGTARNSRREESPLPVKSSQLSPKDVASLKTLLTHPDLFPAEDVHHEGTARSLNDVTLTVELDGEKRSFSIPEGDSLPGEPGRVADRITELTGFKPVYERAHFRPSDAFEQQSQQRLDDLETRASWLERKNHPAATDFSAAPRPSNPGIP